MQVEMFKRQDDVQIWSSGLEIAIWGATAYIYMVFEARRLDSIIQEKSIDLLAWGDSTDRVSLVIRAAEQNWLS